MSYLLEIQISRECYQIEGTKSDIYSEWATGKSV